MVNIYAVNCASLMNDAHLQASLSKLDSTRRARIARLQDAQKRAQCAAAGLLLTHLFGKDGQPPSLTHGSRGKPYLTGDNVPYFNLTHSGDWVFCAVADSEVGIDAQQQTPNRDKIAERWFTAEERVWLSKDPDGRFAPLWAQKEAYCKFTGFGLVLPPSSFTVPCSTDGWDERNRCCWRLFSYPADVPIAISVCCAQNDTFDNITLLTLNELL